MQQCRAAVGGRPAAAAAAARSRRRGAPRRSAVVVRAAVAATEHVRYVNEIAVVPGKPRVETLLQVGWAEGCQEPRAAVRVRCLVGTALAMPPQSLVAMRACKALTA